MDISNTKNLNVFLLGLGFLLTFAAFQTMGNIQAVILDSASDPHSSGYVPGFKGSGYTSLAIIYTVFSLANWLAPPIVALLGPRPTMVLGSLLYLLFIGQFWHPNTFVLYGCSALLGFGAALVWTAQGNFLTINSEPETMSRNSGVFWAMLQTSMLVGNTFVFFQFRGRTDVDTATRSTVVAFLLGVCAAGVAVLAALRPTPWVLASSGPPAVGSSARSSPVSAPDALDTPDQAFWRSWKLLWTPDMLLLSVAFLYTGLELTFFSGVYGPCVGFTKRLGENSKSLVGIHGIMVGLGEIAGGLLFGIFGHTMNNKGRDPIAILGFIVHMAAFFLTFLNLPNSAPFGDTEDRAYIASNEYIAMLCSLLLGFGDACYNTQIFSLLGGVYPNNSVSAFALFKFVQSTGAAAAFYYSGACPLYYQLLVLAVFCALGTTSFVKVELKNQRLNPQPAGEAGDPEEPGGRPGSGMAGREDAVSRSSSQLDERADLLPRE